MFVEGDEGQPIELTWKFSIKPISGSLYFKKAKYNNNEIM